MRKRAFFLLTLLLFIAAILTDLAAKHFAAGAAMTMARAAGTTAAGDQTAHADEARDLARAHDTIAIVACGLLLAGVVSWMCSLRRREAGLHSVLLVLLFVVALMQLVMV